jgi:hypothetical protein
LTIERDERMKQWPGASRHFLLDLAGNDTPAKPVEFRGERLIISL